MNGRSEDDDDIRKGSRRKPTNIEKSQARRRATRAAHVTKDSRAGDDIKQEPSDDSDSEDEEVTIGAIRVDGERSNQNDHEEWVANPNIRQQGVSESHEFTVEAHVVEESSGLQEEERQKFELETRERLLSELTGRAAQAEVVIDNDDKEERKSFIVWICICLVLVLIAIISTGVLVSRQKSTKDRVSSSLSTTSPEDPSHHPSLMPTAAPLNNSVCEEAHSLLVGQNVSGSFEEAFYVEATYCQTGAISVASLAGFWYMYKGEGFPVVMLTNDSVNIYLYLDCVPGSCNEEGFFEQVVDGGRRVQWQAELGTDYFLFVSKLTVGEPINQNFTLTVETNDSLETAFGPVVVPAAGTIVSGSTVGTRVASDVSACGRASAPSGPGVWYSVVGNGKMITASTCGSATGLDTQISVLSTDNSCLAGDDDYCGKKSQVIWSSAVDELYYVLVHGKSGAEGNFVLQLQTEGGSIAEADFCANALLVEVNSTTIVDLSKATDDPDISPCPYWGFFQTTSGNFYRFTGTGGPVSIILPDAPPFVSILTGSSCDSLDCLVPDWSDQELLPTVLGQDYYIYLYYVDGDIPGNLTTTILEVS